jgi:hypothetical protein
MKRDTQIERDKAQLIVTSFIDSIHGRKGTKT